MNQPSPQDAIRAELLANEMLEHLAVEVPDATDDAPTRIAFVGPYNAGKSSLISALTSDLSISRDSKPETAEVTYYDWNGFHLVDLPGWFSGFEAHDETADDELRLHADLVAFCLTVELGDHNTQDAIERVLGDLGFADRAVVIVNKSNSEDSGDGVILAEIAKRLKGFPGVPRLLTDAQDYLDTIEGVLDLDEAALAFLQRDSNVPELEELLLGLAGRKQDARADAQAQQTHRVLNEAIGLLVPDPEEVAGRALLSDLETVFRACQARLENARASEQARLVKELSGLANDVIENIRQGGTYENGRASAARHWSDAHRQALGRLNQTLERELDQLSEDTATTLNLVPLEEVDSVGHGSGPSPGPSKPSLLKRMFDALELKPNQILNPLAQEADRVARGGKGKDSIAYVLARELQPNKVFKPHGRLKDAAKIHDAAAKASKLGKVLPSAFPALLEGANWWRELRADQAAKERDAKIRADYETEALTASNDLSLQFQEWLDVAFPPLATKLAAMGEPLDELRVERHAQIERLEALRRALSNKADATAEPLPESTATFPDGSPH